MDHSKATDQGRARHCGTITIVSDDKEEALLDGLRGWMASLFPDEGMRVFVMPVETAT